MSVKGSTGVVMPEVPPAIEWSEGMLLAPQHFQWLTTRAEALLQYHAATISPFHWGVTRLEIDTNALKTGTFWVKELEAVMPDGLIVRWPREEDGSGASHTINLLPYKAALAERPMRIHLAVAARRRGAAVHDRYEARDEADVRDEHGKACAIESMRVLEPKLHVFAGDLPDRPYVYFPLAEVEYRGEIFARTSYEPPCLRVGRGSAIYELCDRLATQLRDKALARVGKAGSSALMMQPLEERQLVHSLVGALPMFEAVLLTGLSHPYPLYLALCALLGHVAGYGQSLVPARLGAYDHNELVATFDKACAVALQALAEGKQDAYSEHVFRREQDEFRLPFQPEWSGKPLVLAVRAPHGVPDTEVAQWVDGSVIGGRLAISRLRDHRMTGLRRVPCETQGTRGVSLYSLLPDAEMLAAGDELVIVNPDAAARRPQEIVLHVRDGI